MIKRRQHGSSSTGGINYRFVLYTSLLISYVQQKCINPFDIRWEKLCRWVRFISWDVGCNLHFDTKCAMHLIYVITTLKIMRGCSCSQQHALLMPWISWTINTKPRKNAPYTLTPFAHGKKCFSIHYLTVQKVTSLYWEECWAWQSCHICHLWEDKNGCLVSFFNNIYYFAFSNFSDSSDSTAPAQI